MLHSKNIACRAEICHGWNFISVAASCSLNCARRLYRYLSERGRMKRNNSNKESTIVSISKLVINNNWG